MAAVVDHHARRRGLLPGISLFPIVVNVVGKQSGRCADSVCRPPVHWSHGAQGDTALLHLRGRHTKRTTRDHGKENDGVCAAQRSEYG